MACKPVLAASLLAAAGATKALQAECKYPGGNCYELAMQTCKGSKTFTLHGLWAQWSNVCSGETFSLDALSPIMDELNAKWSSCQEDGGNNEKFWKHEWDKHGVCSGMDQLSFFKKTLELYDEHHQECHAGDHTCSICFSKDFSTEEQCQGSVVEKKPHKPKPSVADIECKYPGGNCYELAMQTCQGSSTYTLHGLWAQWSNECHGPSFNLDVLNPIMDELKAKWFSCPEDGGNNAKFWQHEWEKHGVCSGLTQLQFFKETLALYDAHHQECKGGSTCAICFSKDFSTEEQCAGSFSKELKTVQV